MVVGFANKTGWFLVFVCCVRCCSMFWFVVVVFALFQVFFLGFAFSGLFRACFICFNW